MDPLKQQQYIAIVASLGAAVAISITLRQLRRRKHPELPWELAAEIDLDNYLKYIRGNSRASGTQIVRAYADRRSNEQTSLYIVTGATSGLGLQTARSLASMRDAYIIIGCRDTSVGQEVAKEMSGRAECIRLDLTSFELVRSFAMSVIERSKSLGVPIRGLVNNAGVHGVSGTTKDGYQTTFQTNVLSGVLLTELLVPYTSKDFRLVNVASEMMKMVWGSTRKEGRAFPPVNGGGSDWDYALSKACQGLHAHELNLRWAKENDTNQRRAFAIEPGLVQTNMARHMPVIKSRLMYFLLTPIVRSIDEGTANILFCLLAPSEHLDYEWNYEDGGKERIRPFYYANCMALMPPKCCRCHDDALLQNEVFRSVLRNRL